MVEEPSKSPRFLRIGDVALELATSDSQIYALVRSGELRAIQIGGRGQWRIERVKLEEYIQEAYRRSAEHVRDLPTSSEEDEQRKPDAVQG